MTKLTRGLLVSDYDQRDTEMLGDATNQYAKADIGKAVSYAGVQMDLSGAGVDIVGFVETVEAATSDGHSVGTVKKSGRFRVQVGAAEVGTVDVGEAVVADVQTALGTAGYAQVKAGAGTLHKWVCVWIEGAGTGVTGDTIIVEKV